MQTQILTGQSRDDATSNTAHTTKTNPELAQRIARWATTPHNTQTAVTDLIFHRWTQPTDPMSYMLSTNICLIGQGAKRVMLGDEMYLYDSQHFLLSSLDLPVVAQITDASPQKPYLGMTLHLDLKVLSQLMVDSELPPPKVRPNCKGVSVSPLDPALANAIYRLIDLLDTPEDIPVMAPLIQREICYRLLMGEQGPRLRQMVTAGSHSQSIAKAINWLKESFAQSFQVADLAELVGMSTSTFHEHFRALTAMTPLQFQKKLRLNEARRLMLTEDQDAANAAFMVGYESPSQFNREYKRMFGAPPLRDIKQLRQLALTK